MITILGASGFIGTHLVENLKKRKETYYAPLRNENLLNKDLGDVIYCIGMTSDFRTKPFETVEAHVSKLSFILKECKFTSLTYLSSTRVYINCKSFEKKVNELDAITLNINNPFDLYNSTKITGELLALNSGRENIRVVRLSNVFGSDFYSNNFITSIIKDGLNKSKIELFTTPDSAKDYISIEDVSNSLYALIDSKLTGVFNLAFGENTPNSEILSKISQLTGAQIIFSKNAEKIIFPEIDNSKLVKGISLKPKNKVIESLEEIVLDFKRNNILK